MYMYVYIYMYIYIYIYTWQTFRIHSQSFYRYNIVIIYACMYTCFRSYIYGRPFIFNELAVFLHVLTLSKQGQRLVLTVSGCGVETALALLHHVAPRAQHLYVRVNKYVYEYICIYIYIYTYIFTNIYIYIHGCVCVSWCVCICVCLSVAVCVGVTALALSRCVAPRAQHQYLCVCKHV